MKLATKLLSTRRCLGKPTDWYSLPYWNLASTSMSGWATSLGALEYLCLGRVWRSWPNCSSWMIFASTDVQYSWYPWSSSNTSQSSLRHGNALFDSSENLAAQQAILNIHLIISLTQYSESYVITMLWLKFSSFAISCPACCFSDRHLA